MRITAKYSKDDYVSIFRFETDSDEGVCIYWTLDGVATQVVLTSQQRAKLLRLLQ